MPSAQHLLQDLDQFRRLDGGARPGADINARANLITPISDPNSDQIIVVAQNINDDLYCTLYPGS